MATASQSLFNMTVASDNAGGNAGLLMPKLQFRFRVNFINFGLENQTTVLTRQVIDAARPNVTFQEIRLQVYNSTVKIAGKHTWNNITVNLRDDAAGGVSRLVGQQLQRQMDFVEQASAASGQNYKFVMFVEVLDGGNGATAPTVLETWECYGCYVTQANYNALGYGGQEMLTIDLTIQPDNCIQTTGGAAAPTLRATGTAATASGNRV